MKEFAKTEDQAIDNLLGAHLGQRGAIASDCAGFDPDIANAYIERALTAAEISKYEGHIAACSPCRKGMVMLAQMAQAEQAPSQVETAATIPAREPAAAGGLFGLKELFAFLTAPRAAIAAIAIIVIAVSVPVYLSRKGGVHQDTANQSDTNQLAEVNKEAPASPQATNPPTSVNPSQDGSATLTGEKQEVEARARSQSEVAGSPSASEEKASGPEPPQTQRVEPVAAPAAEVATGNIAAAQPTAPPPPPAAQEKELDKIDSRESLRVKDKDRADMSVIQPARISSDLNKRESDDKTIRPNDVVPPPTETKSDETAGRKAIASNTPANAFGEGRARKSSRPRGTPERRIGNKRFYKLNDVWTDKDYNPDKERPEVTIIRDSDVYDELIAKHRSLKLYFTNFAKDERAIVIYKDTVYRLMPQ